MPAVAVAAEELLREAEDLLNSVFVARRIVSFTSRNRCSVADAHRKTMEARQRKIASCSVLCNRSKGRVCDRTDVTSRFVRQNDEMDHVFLFSACLHVHLAVRRDRPVVRLRLVRQDL